ncbi:mediator complex subunit [Coemansia thaxteri]|uniref:Mediator of RNA polymerase II transcription subunit 14 n=1 Tax=Coemansia thaxteri TaxID=2663907 RepID=A0A9W8EHB2_9FUNG|nr:mediator complex subunit [Coemansia thaxteri]
MWSAVQRVPSRQELSASSSGGGRNGVPSMDMNCEAESQQQQQQQARAGGRGLHIHSSRQPGRSRGSSDSDSGGSDAGAGSDAGSELAQITVQMIPLREIVDRLVTFAYTELVTLVDTLPSRGEAERRGEIVKYADHVTELLTQLLVLVRWAKNARAIQKCQNVIAYLDRQNRFFEYSVDSIYAAFLALGGVRVGCSDVGTAVDVLTTGTYRRLPAAVGRAVGPAALRAREARHTLRAVDDIIRERMLRGEAVPAAMRRFAIARGRIVFTVPREFEATLTLLQRGRAVPWHVVSVRVLAGGARRAPELAALAQHVLVGAAGGAAPLAQLFDVLHRQSLGALVEAVARQAAALQRTRWEGALLAELGADRAAVVLRYWTSPRAAAGAGANSVELRIVPLPVPRAIHAPAAGDAAGDAAGADGSADDFRHIELLRRDLIPKVGIAVSWTAHAGLAAPLTWQHTAATAAELGSARLALDAAAVDTAQLLRQATWLHANAILAELHAAAGGAAELAYVAPSGRVVDACDAEREAAAPRLRAWYRDAGEGAVDVTVDALSGRLRVRAAPGLAGSAALGDALVAQLAERVNRTPARLAALLADLRAGLALADLDALAERALGLRRQAHSAGGGFPLRVAPHDASMLARDIGGEARAPQRLRFYRVEGTEGAGEWHLMAAMTDRLRFRLVCLAPQPADRLARDVTHVVSLQVDRLFASVARRLAAAAAAAPGPNQPDRSPSALAEAMLAGRTAIALDYVNALAAACRARLAVRALQEQLARRQIPYAFRLPPFSTSPHGPRAAVSQELSVVGIDRMGLYELDEQVPVLHVPVAALMRAAPVNWRVAARAVLPDEARRMVSVRVAADELDAPPRAAPAPARRTLHVGRHVVPCHVVASVPVALDGLPLPVAQAYADAVYFGAHAARDGGYHRAATATQETDAAAAAGYTKVVLVYRRVARALQSLIRDWAELHLMTHVARHMHAWEQRALRRVMASTIAYYPFSPGPYTAAADAAGVARPAYARQSAEIVVQCIGSCFLSISCCVPPPRDAEDIESAADAPSELAYHMTLADVDPKTGQTVCIASTWPCSSPTHASAAGVSPSLSRWLRTLQARLNLTANPLAVLSILVQLMPLRHILASISSAPTAITRSLQPPSLALALDSAPPSNCDQPHLFLNKLVSLSKGDVGQAFESVRGLHVMHMYTAADNMRLVFNSHYVVDLRLVSTELFHITDAVGAARATGDGSPQLISRAKQQQQQQQQNQPPPFGNAPEPLVTAATEPIPLFADWLEAMARGMRFDWDKLEKWMAAFYTRTDPGNNESSGEASCTATTLDADKRERTRSFRRNLHRLRPGASQIEQYMDRIREITSKQTSARAPTFVVLPPAGVLCTKFHLIPVLRSLMQWLVQSVNVRDLLESAIARTQELTEPSTGLPKDSLFCIKEKLVFTERQADSSGRQVMIVGFTGARDSVRCEFLMQVGVTTESASSQQPAATAASTEPVDELGNMALMSDLYSVPSNLMRVDLDVRIVPMNRPPNGITDAAAAYLIAAFKRQPTDIRQRAGVLVRILSLPPQLVMDIVDIGKRLEDKAGTCALIDGYEHAIRVNAAEAKVTLSMRFSDGAVPPQWTRVGMDYMLLSGTAKVVWVADSLECSTAPSPPPPQLDDGSCTPASTALTSKWSALVQDVVAALDAETAFTRDMGKSGKSRWFDLVSRLCERAARQDPGAAK